MKYRPIIFAALLLAGLGVATLFPATPDGRQAHAHPPAPADEADAPRPQQRTGQPSGDRRRGGDTGTRSLERASGLKAAGRCKEAIPIYACFAGRGRGYQIAQISLAQCLAAEAALLPDGEENTRLGRQALYWADRAAAFGDPAAQGFLAYHYLAGDLAPVDAIEGGKWYYLFERNPRHVALGLGRLPEGTYALANKMLDEAADAEARAGADAWRQIYDASGVPPGMMPANGCVLERDADGGERRYREGRREGEEGGRRGRRGGGRRR